MGLDITLYKCKNKEMYIAKENQGEEISESVWESKMKEFGVEDYDNLTDGQKEIIRDEVKTRYKEIGLDEDGSPIDIKMERDEEASERHPGHLFQRGYFRSSYNPSGINSVLPQYLGEDITLYTIFNKGEDDEYYFTPDWQAAKENVVEAISMLKEKMKDTLYRTTSESFFHGAAVHSEGEALFLFNKHKERQSTLSNYFSGEGAFFLEEPLKLSALIPGKDILKNPCVYLVYEDTAAEHYLQSLEIVEETIDYVLSKKNPNHYCLGWSA